jgi:alkylhydroperoxidase family enzyme
MDDRFSGTRRHTEEHILGTPGETSSALRAAAAKNSGDLPGDLAAYIDKVHRHAHRITDEEVAALRASGRSDDAIVELTWAAAVGAASAHFAAAARALGKGGAR